MKRQSIILLGGWLVLAAFLLGMGWQNLAAPGLYYDEAIHGGLAKDFLTGQPNGSHLPGGLNVEIFGRPFPIFVQLYSGALRCWLLLPMIKLCGSTLAVLRGANLLFCAITLLVFMAWTWRLLGLMEALLTGLLLAADPAFFFPSVLDWGPLLPSLLCRAAGFLLVLLAWRRQQMRWALAAGLVLGLGLFNKIDFGMWLAAIAAAAAIAYGPSLKALAGHRRNLIFMAALGFAVGGGPMFSELPAILHYVSSNGPGPQPSEFPEKLNTHLAMYDGSYVYRLMDVGGLFDKMDQASSPVWTPFGILVLFAILVLVADVIGSAPETPARRTKLWLLLAAAFVTLGVLILPGAVRIHHATLVYPFPHLIIAAAVVFLWNREWKTNLRRHCTRGLLVVVLLSLVTSEVHATRRTEQLIRETGGRGWWSNALMQFADTIKDRPDLTVDSMDWGFNEQLEFLTDKPHLEEPFWAILKGGKASYQTDHLYLVHPPEFSVFPLGAQFMDYVSHHEKSAVVQPWRDAQGRIVFYTIGFNKP